MVSQQLGCSEFFCQFPNYCTMLDDGSKLNIQYSTLCHLTNPLTAELERLSPRVFVSKS